MTSEKGDSGPVLYSPDLGPGKHTTTPESSFIERVKLYSSRFTGILSLYLTSRSNFPVILATVSSWLALNAFFFKSENELIFILLWLDGLLVKLKFMVLFIPFLAIVLFSRLFA